MNSNNSTKMTIVPVMITFFTMGFVDLVGAVSNNMQEDFGLSDSAANFFPSLVFFWFLIFIFFTDFCKACNRHSFRKIDQFNT